MTCTFSNRYLHSLANIPPAGEVPFVGKSAALLGFHGLDCTVASIEEGAFTVGFVEQGETTTAGLQAGMFIDKFLFTESEKGRDLSDVVVGELYLARPLAAICAALALIIYLASCGHRISSAMSLRMRILVTGGCGFIGSNFVRFLLGHYQPLLVTNVDALTYAGNVENTSGVAEDFGDRYEFFQADIADASAMREILAKQKYYAVVNFAAESHVDRSILSSQNFVHSNVMGVNVLLELCREFQVKRFLQISTDEVYGDHSGEAPFTENTPLNPSSPYSASKASADILVMAAAKTYGQEVIITRCTNNYGSFQHPEKFIPRAITQALSDDSLPVYGDGAQRRDWLHVHDHCRALQAILLEGRAGEIYNISAGHELSNLELAKQIVQKLGKPESLIRHVTDRRGHDRRYFISSEKLSRKLDWKPNYDFEIGLEETLQWYQTHRDWWEPKRKDLLQTLPS